MNHTTNGNVKFRYTCFNFIVILPVFWFFVISIIFYENSRCNNLSSATKILHHWSCKKNVKILFLLISWTIYPLEAFNLTKLLYSPLIASMGDGKKKKTCPTSIFVLQIRRSRRHFRKDERFLQIFSSSFSGKKICRYNF